MKRFEYVGYLLAVVIVLIWVGLAVVGRLLTEPPSVKMTQEDFERNVAWVSHNRAEYRREGAAERRKEMQDRAHVEAQQDDAWKVIDESLGLLPPEITTMLDKLEQLDRSLPKIEKQESRPEVGVSLVDLGKDLQKGQAVVMTRQALRDIISELKAADQKAKEMKWIIDYLEIGISGKYQSFAEFLRSHK